MKIVFVSANRERLPDAVVPLGLLSVMAATPAHHERSLCDLCFEADPLETLQRHLLAEKPDVVAMGLRNVQNSDYTGITSNIDYYRSLIATIRAAGSATVVVGGAGFSVMPRQLMCALKPDYGIAGEGEGAFAELVEALEVGPRTHGLSRGAGDVSRVAGLHYFEGGQVRDNPLRPGFLDLDVLPWPDRSAVDARYYREAGIESVQTKRGCALRCDYCTYPLIEGRVVRSRSPEAVVDEMIQRQDECPDIRHFFIVDSVFNIPPRHAKAVCEAMIARSFNTPWTCYANPLGFDEELAQLMVEAGCAGVEIGADSGCDDILKKLRKGFDSAKLREVHALSAKHGLKDCHTFLLGTPGETIDHAKRTIDFIVDLDPFAAVLMAYKDDTEALDPVYARQRQALRDEVIALLDTCRPAFPRWIIPALEVNFQARLFQMLRKRGLRGPLWQYLDQIPRVATIAPKPPHSHQGR